MQFTELPSRIRETIACERWAVSRLRLQVGRKYAQDGYVAREIEWFVSIARPVTRHNRYQVRVEAFLRPIKGVSIDSVGRRRADITCLYLAYTDEDPDTDEI